MTVFLMSKAEILKTNDPDLLFKDKSDYKKLALQWHPDKGGDTDAFSHIAIMWSLYKKVHTATVSIINYSAIDVFEYRLKFKTDAGMCYINNDFVLFEIDINNIDLCSNFINCMNFIHARKDSKIKKYFSTILPSMLIMRNESSEFIYLMFAIPNKMVPLSLVLDQYSGKIPAASVAWIISRMLNLSVYCERHRIALNSYTLASFWINPEKHVGCDIAGWFFSTQERKKLLALPNGVKNIYPLDLVKKRIGSSVADGVLIRNTAAKLLGDKTGSGFKLNREEVPKELINWITTPSIKLNNFEMYENWYRKVLPESFGERKFTKMGITSDLIYAKYGGK